MISLKTNFPRILRVETGYLARDKEPDQDYLDYGVYRGFPRWLRQIELKLRSDIYLALQARKIANNYDIIWARSEKAAIPLSFLGIKKPMVVSAHYLESPIRTAFIKATGIARKWAAIGYYSEGQKNFIIEAFGVNEDRMFFSEAPHYLHIDPSKSTYEGPIVSLGVSKRDYPTLLGALSTLEGCSTELYISSKFGDILSQDLNVPSLAWVKYKDFVPQSEIIQVYQKTRFVIVPLMDTKQTSAGLNAIFEAGAFGKAVVATRNNGTEAFVIDGKTGILVPPNDIDAMKKAIQKLWNDPELAREMGLAARKHLELNYSPDVIYSKMNTLFSKIYHEHQSN